MPLVLNKNEHEHDHEEADDAESLFSSIENRIIDYKSKLSKSSEDGAGAGKFELVDRNDIRTKLNDQFDSLMNKHFTLLKQQLQSKSTPKITLIQETCVRLLTLAVQHSFELARQIAVEFNYFSERKNWLEKFLFMKQTDLREMSVEFLLSYLKYGKSDGTDSAAGSKNEPLILIKKILFKSESPGADGQQQQQQQQSLWLIQNLFVHVNTDSKQSIEYLMHELMFKFVQNDAFNKSDRIRLFNERTLAHLIKVYEWRDDASQTDEQDDKNANTLHVRQIVNEFLKFLFGSTKYGISFYDKTLNIDQSSRNYNHLIFNSLVGLPRFGVKVNSTKQASKTNSNNNNNNQSAWLEVNVKTNELIDDLILKTLKVCPDLIQRYLKVKQKQESNKDDEEYWFFRLCVRLFEQQQSTIRSMVKNLTGNTSFLRCFNSTDGNINQEELLTNIITHTSMPLCISFQKLFATQTNQPDEASQVVVKHELSLRLFIACLKCLREWQMCLNQLKHDRVSADADTVRRNILDNLHKILRPTDSEQDPTEARESFFAKLNLDLLAKHLPKFDTFIARLNNTHRETDHSTLVYYFGIFTLYFEIFMNKNAHHEYDYEAAEDQAQDEDGDNSDWIANNCFNLLEVDKLVQVMNSHLAKMLTTSSSQPEEVALAHKYLHFLINYIHLKQTFLHESDIVQSDQNAILYNCVRILSKFRAESEFKLLISSLLQLVDVYLRANPIVKFDRDFMYLWFLMARRCLDEARPEITASLVDYFYTCFRNFLDARQLNLIVLEMDQQQRVDDLANFNKMLTIVCVKSAEKLANSAEAAAAVRSFLIDYIFNSSLMLNDQLDQAPSEMFKYYVRDELLGSSGDELDALLNEKLAAEVKGVYKKRESVIVDGSEFKIDTYSQAFMYSFQNAIRFRDAALGDETIDAQIIHMNTSLRARHFMYLIGLLFKNEKHFKMEVDLEVLTCNLNHCIRKAYELYRLNTSTINREPQSAFQNERKVDDATTRSVNFLKQTDNLIKRILKNGVILENSFSNEMLIQFVHSSLEALNTYEHLNVYVQLYVERFLQYEQLPLTNANVKFISELNLDKRTLHRLLDRLLAFTDLDQTDRKQLKVHLNEHLELFKLILDLTLRNRDKLFELDISLYDQLNSLDQRHFDSVRIGAKLLRYFLLSAVALDVDEIIPSPNEQKSLVDFLVDFFHLAPYLFRVELNLLKLSNDKYDKYVRKFVSKLASSDRLVHILDLCFSPDELPLELAEKNESVNGQHDAKKSLTSLLEVYEFSMSPKDTQYLREIYKLDASLQCLVFTVVDADATKSDILNRQAKMADFLSLRLNESKLTDSILNFPIGRKLEDLKEDSNPTNNAYFNKSTIYDPIYVLPNIYHLLHYGNLVDVIQFVQSKVLSYLFASLSSECDRLRTLAYGSIYRFASHLENSKAYFRGIIMHMINMIRLSLTVENQRLPTVISVFLAEAVMIVIEPGTVLYKPLTSFLLIKPILDLYQAPEFYKLFNSSSLEYKAERKWIMTVLSYSCRNSLDYRIMEKRFIFRQLMGIYDSRLSDFELKHLIVNLFVRACESKYALIDLVKKHYFLIWITSVVNSIKPNNDAALFYKFIRLFNLIWRQLGASSAKRDPPAAPITFLNQMYVLAKVFLRKLVENNRRLIEFNTDEWYRLVESTANASDICESQRNTAGLNKQREHIDDLKTLFNNYRHITASIGQYGFNMTNLDDGTLESMFKNYLAHCSNGDFTFSSMLSLIDNKRKKYDNNDQTSSKRLKV